MLVEMRGENRRIVRANAANREMDKKGPCSSMLAMDLRFFGVADYALKRDVQSFRLQLSEAAGIQSRLFERYEAGEPIDASYVTMLSYQAQFDALAAANMPLAGALARHMGRRPKLEEHYDHPFDYAMGYTLRAFVLDDRQEMHEWTSKFAAACQKTKMTDFEGYAQVFQAMLSGDADAANQGVHSVVKGHERQAKGRGVFANTDDEVLCVWGVGVANLARSRGLSVQAVPPWIPTDLLL